MTIHDLQQEIINWKLTRYKLINFGIGMAALLVYECIARPYYRPYIYANNIFDFHIADTLGNSLGTAATVFILIAVFTSRPEHGEVLAKIVPASVVLYECAHPLLGKVVDVWDITASIITGVFGYFLFTYLWKQRI